MSIRYSYHIGFVALLLLLAACTKDELADDARLPEGQYPLQIARITLGVEGGEAQPWGTPATRVSEFADGTGSVFSAGDRFAVQINGEEGIYIVQDNNTVKAETPLYWSDRDEAHTVTAWYPATDGTIDLGNQSQSLAYLLSGTGTGDYQTQVTLNFTHALAKVRVTPTDDALGEVQSLQLYAYTQCTYEKGTVVQGSQEGWIKMKKCEYNGVTCWEANVVPDYEITKLMANGDDKERELSASINPKAGSFYNITLNKDKGYTVSEDGKTYTVYTADGLLAWNKAVQNDLTLNCTLTADITLTGEWTPIGTDYRNSYTGTFDGDNHTISGLIVTGSDEYAGLFGYIGSGGTVKNVKLENVRITSDYQYAYVGGVAGNNDGAIENCSVSGSVSGNSTYNSVGGVVGYQLGGSITGCSSSATVQGTGSVGGVVGQTNSGATLTACYSTENVTLESNNSDNNYAGGVVGSNSFSTLIACYATGNVTGTGTGTGSIYVGGVTGDNASGTLTACYHAAETVSGPDGATGGVAGRNFKGSMFGGGIITACYWGSNPNTGIGENQAGTGDTEKVDGDWTEAMKVMNEKLSGTCWKYVPGSGSIPLTLEKQ